MVPNNNSNHKFKWYSTPNSKTEWQRKTKNKNYQTRALTEYHWCDRNTTRPIRCPHFERTLHIVCDESVVDVGNGRVVPMMVIVLGPVCDFLCSVRNRTRIGAASFTTLAGTLTCQQAHKICFYDTTRHTTVAAIIRRILSYSLCPPITKRPWAKTKDISIQTLARIYT